MTRWSPGPTSWWTPSRGSGPRWARSRGRANNPPDHPLLRREPVGGAHLCLGAARDLLLDDAHHPPGRAARPLGHPGHRLLAVGPGAPTSSRTRSPTPSPRRCSARLESGRSVASPTSATASSTSSSRMGTDPYWARTRVLEYLSKITSQLPPGVKTELGPDATSVGWVFRLRAGGQEAGSTGSDEIRELPGLVPPAMRCRRSLGSPRWPLSAGRSGEYQIRWNPNAARQLPHPARRGDSQAVRKGNNDVGGRLVEISGREYMVRGGAGT